MNPLAINLILALDSQLQIFPGKLETRACSIFLPLHSAAKRAGARVCCPRAALNSCKAPLGTQAASRLGDLKGEGARGDRDTSECNFFKREKNRNGCAKGLDLEDEREEYADCMEEKEGYTGRNVFNI